MNLIVSAQRRHHFANAMNIHTARSFSDNTRKHLAYGTRGKSDVLAPSLSHVTEVFESESVTLGLERRKRAIGDASKEEFWRGKQD
jgi:hypothetical protein